MCFFTQHGGRKWGEVGEMSIIVTIYIDLVVLRITKVCPNFTEIIDINI